jgi:hypothetical protein
MNPIVLTGIISALVAVLGTLLAFLGRTKDSTDKRLELLFTVNSGLVDDLRGERNDLRGERNDLQARVTALETAKDYQARELDRLHDELGKQQTELLLLRQRDAELHAWAVEIMTWASSAVVVILDLGGNIRSPPLPSRWPRTVDGLGFPNHPDDPATATP